MKIVVYSNDKEVIKQVRNRHFYTIHKLQTHYYCKNRSFLTSKLLLPIIQKEAETMGKEYRNTLFVFIYVIKELLDGKAIHPINNVKNINDLSGKSLILKRFTFIYNTSNKQSNTDLSEAEIIFTTFNEEVSNIISQNVVFPTTELIPKIFNNEFFPTLIKSISGSLAVLLNNPWDTILNNLQQSDQVVQFFATIK